MEKELKLVLKGIIEGIKDPKQRGRVQVRVDGYHTSDRAKLPSSALSWSSFLNPMDGGGIYGSKSTPVLGAWVYCLDLGNGIEFLVIGVIQTEYKTQPDFSIGRSDPTGTFPNIDDLNHPRNPLVEEPASQPASSTNLSFTATGPAGAKSTILSGVKYPYNNVFFDQQANILEIDASPGAPRVRLQHSSGTKIEFDTHGNIILTAAKNISISSPGLFAINQKDNNVIIEGDLKIIGNVETTGKITANESVTSKAEITDSTGNLSSLRGAYDGHKHTQGAGNHFGAGGVTTVPSTTDPITRESDFGWQGSEV